MDDETFGSIITAIKVTAAGIITRPDVITKCQNDFNCIFAKGISMTFVLCSKIPNPKESQAFKDFTHDEQRAQADLAFNDRQKKILLNSMNHIAMTAVKVIKAQCFPISGAQSLSVKPLNKFMSAVRYETIETSQRAKSA